MDRPSISRSSSVEDRVFTLSPSADDILEVSPANTFESNEPTPRSLPSGRQQQQQQQQQQRHQQNDSSDKALNRLNDDAFSSSSSEDGHGNHDDDDEDDDESDNNDDDDDGDEDDNEDDDDDSQDEDDDLDDEDGDDYTSSEATADQSAPRSRSNMEANSGKKGFASEFDKALHRGKGRPSRGNLQPSVTANIAAPPPPPPQAKKPSSKTQSLATASSGASSVGQVHSNLTATSSTLDHQQHLMNAPMPSTNATSTNLGSMPGFDDPLNGGILPDVLMNMRQKIESLQFFDSDMMKLVQGQGRGMEDATDRETRESLKRSSQQSINAAVLVSLAHKRYERRRLAAMEIEKVVRSLVQQDELERVRAILLLLSDDYVRSTSEDARKGGVVALAASAIGLKKAPESNWLVHECRDLILASVVHACQDHSQRVRYYATESLFNVVKVIPSLAVQHFFILFEILRSLYADVDLDVKSGAELLDKKLKEVIVGAMNSGQFTADACVPVFARFVYMRNKATKRLTLTWLQELAEKLIGAPILEFLHLLLGGIFDMVADPTLAIRQSALAFLQSVLPKLLTVEDHVQEEAIDDMDGGDGGMKVDFDKILQSLVTTMEHPDPFVRKVAMYWMSRIVKAHIDGPSDQQNKRGKLDLSQGNEDNNLEQEPPQLSAATISVRNSLPHVLPGILLSIGDTFKSNNSIKDSFLPDQTTHALAEQTNTCLQDAVRRDGRAYVHHLDSFIVALREELDSPGGVNARNPPAMERKPYRMDVKQDGTGIESQGWFRASKDTKQDDEDSMMMSRLCALHWVIVLYESVVPDMLKADYAREFIVPIIHHLVDNPPEQIIFKSLEVLATITVPVTGEMPSAKTWSTMPSFNPNDEGGNAESPMSERSVSFALDILDADRRLLKSRDREVFAVLIHLHANNLHLIGDVSKVIAYMCRLQPPEFVCVSFAVELDKYADRQFKKLKKAGKSEQTLSRELQFVSSFVQQLCHVLLNSQEAKSLRDSLRDCIGHRSDSELDRRRTRLFHILLHCFAHNLVASTALCLWGGAFRTASLFLSSIDPLDIHLMFLLELDKLVEMIERPLFRHLHVRMLECDKDPMAEGSGTMLFQVLKVLLMIIPQSTCYNLLRDRLVSTSRFRQSVITVKAGDYSTALSKETAQYVDRVLDIRELHCEALWETIRFESLETKKVESKEEEKKQDFERGNDRREWLGYASKEEESIAQARYREDKRRRQASGVVIEELGTGYKDLGDVDNGDTEVKSFIPDKEDEEAWKEYWAQNTNGQT